MEMNRGEGVQKETDIMLDKVSVAESDMDKKCHELFLNKEILAPILQETVEEYKDLTVGEIIELIDEDSITKAEAVSDFPLAKDVRIEQIDTDMKSVSDKLILYDIHFKAALPKDKRTKLNFRLYIDFEPQGKYYLSYPLVKRAMYYVARGLVSQLGELTEETDYGQLQKTYSIWVCYDPQIPKKLKNTLSHYKMTREDFFGDVDEPFTDYDLMEVVFVRLDAFSESNEKIFDYLKGVFTNDKEKIMKQTGPLPDKVAREVDSMSGVGALMVEKGRREGRREGRMEGRMEGRIKALYNDAGFTIEEIAKKINMTKEEIKDILSSLDED